MDRKKYGGRDPIITICLRLVETHEDRKESIELARLERSAMEMQIKALKINDMPRGSGGTGDPVFELYAKMESLEEYIADEQRRVNAVDRAINRIGHYERDPATREQMRAGILKNIQMGGHVIPYEYAGYPEKYDRNQFYAQRKSFIMEIARSLNLMLRC